MQGAMQDRHIAVRRDDVGTVCVDRHVVGRLTHLHARAPHHQIAEDALVGRVEVLNQHEGHAAVGRHVRKKQLECLQSAGRRTDPYDGNAPAAIIGSRPAPGLGVGSVIWARLHLDGALLVPDLFHGWSFCRPAALRRRYSIAWRFVDRLRIGFSGGLGGASACY